MLGASAAHCRTKAETRDMQSMSLASLNCTPPHLTLANKFLFTSLSVGQFNSICFHLCTKKKRKIMFLIFWNGRSIKGGTVCQVLEPE